MRTRSVAQFPLWPTASSLLQLFVRQLQRLDGDGTVGGVKARARPLRRPSVEEVPAQLLVAGLVHQDDGAVLALAAPVQHRLAPLPQLVGVRNAPLERDVREAVQARELSLVVGVCALP